MEAIAATSEGKWGSFCGTFAEEADFIAQFLNSSSVPNEINDCSMSAPSVFWPFHDPAMNMAGFADNSYLSLDFASSRFCSFSEGSSYGGESLSQQSYYMCDPQPILASFDSPISMDSSSYLFNGDDCLNREFGEGNAGLCAGNMPEALLPETGAPKPESIPEVKSNKPSENFKKRCLNSGYVQKNERITQSKKQQKLSSISEVEEAGKPGLVGQSSSSSSSEDGTNAFPELEGEETPSLSTKWPAALNSKGKTRAGRGSASDPQSIYARKRREKINARLRILQNLVPNGTKVDITTMLEEAVEYVKFLQLQIKLLSSDDLWMYAPIAYSGMDIGLDRKITVLNSL